MYVMSCCIVSSASVGQNDVCCGGTEENYGMEENDGTSRGATAVEHR